MPDARPPLTTGRTLDHVAWIYDWLAPVMTLGTERRYRQLAIGHLGVKQGDRLLDVGCGTGVLTLQLARLAPNRPASVTGIDAAPRMIARARRKLRGETNIRFDVAAAERLPYEAGTFDAAVSTLFFHHIDFALKQRALAELHRVLKPGGRLVVVDVDVPVSWFGRLCAWSGYWLFQQDEIRENIRGRLREAFAQSPFQAWTAVSSHAGYITLFELTKAPSR